MSSIKLVLYFSVLCLTEATINICIPLHSSDVKATSPHKLLKEIKNDISTMLSVEENKPNFDLDHIDLDINHPAIRIQGALDNVLIYNLHDFIVCFLENLELNATSHTYKFDVFNLTFKNVRVEGEYNITGDLGDIFDLFGDGNFWVELRNFSIAMTDFTFNVGDEICFPINIDIYLAEMGNHFFNFMDDDELEKLFNDVITSIAPESLGIIWEEMKEIFDKPLEDEINDILHGRNVRGVFNILRNLKMDVTSAPYCYDTADLLE
ncbi:hypothetical protein MTP99_015640 [Tenebrio molitor]|jgi:hypothetical protein|nr:hypothetical protein MTP99_015640 [Tenebrio molitor]